MSLKGLDKSRTNGAICALPHFSKHHKAVEKVTLNQMMTLIHATLDLKYPKEEFLEHCTEHGVKPDLDLLRSWLIEKCIQDDAANSIQISCPNQDCGVTSDLT